MTKSPPFKTTINGPAGNPALLMMVESGRAYWGEAHLQPLHAGAPLKAALGWYEVGDALRLQLQPPPGVLLPPIFPPLYIDPVAATVGTINLPAGVDNQLLSALHDAPAVPRREAQRLSRMLALHYPQLPTPEPITVRELATVTPVPQLTIHATYRGSGSQTTLLKLH